MFFAKPVCQAQEKKKSEACYLRLFRISGNFLYVPAVGKTTPIFRRTYLRYIVLGSGSKGNATLVEAGKTRILIDNGFSGKELIARLSAQGITAESLTALVITHEHNDHIQGVGVLARRLNLPVFANVPTHRAAESRCQHIPHRREFNTGESFTIADLRLHAFSVSHDTADPVGFVFDDGHSRLGYCTDTGKITRLIKYHLEGCQALILEANHDVEMVKKGPYPLHLQQRVLSHYGHLANAASLELAASLAEDRLRTLVLAHISEINNSPQLLTQEVKKYLHSFVRLQVLCASQHGGISPLEVRSEED